MSLPKVLVIDDQFSLDATERELFLFNAGLVDDEGRVDGNVVPFAEVEFCSGQRKEEGRLVNDSSVVIEKARQEDWSMVLLDAQFDSGDLDEIGAPIGQPGDARFGLEIRRELGMALPELPIVMLSSKSDLELGEHDRDYDYLSKTGLGSYELRRALLKYGRLAPGESRFLLELNEGVYAEDPSTLAAFRDAFIHADSGSNVLLLGENGVGKEVLANYLHSRSKRDGKPFVGVNVAAIPEGLVESELFGHEKGAFTGASARTGRFELADGGTLFLDEIGDMSLEIQAKVLRALETRTITRLGSAKEIPVDIRLVCATSHDLSSRVEEGLFRPDLLYRINTVDITLPPLRSRPKDVSALANNFLEALSEKQGKVGISFSKGALKALQGHSFPGNVRELRNVVERLVGEAGNHQVIRHKEALKTLGSNVSVAPVSQSKQPGEEQSADTSSEVMALSLASLPKWLDLIPIDKDDPALKGIKPELDVAIGALYKRLAGAVLERCRDPVKDELVLQCAMRLLSGNPSLDNKGPRRLINSIINDGRGQDVKPDQEKDLEPLVRLWKEHRANGEG